MPLDRAPVTHPVLGSSILITGATGGMGRALAAELHRRGARLTLVSRDARRLEELPIPGNRLAVDLRTPEGCERAIDAAVTHEGSLDVLVNAVGVVAFGAVSELSIDAMEELFLTNTFVPIMLARAGIGRLNRGGAIVNISGVVAEQNLPNMAAYGASKAAVRSFDEALAREARRTRIRVIDARPPHTETGLSERAIEGRAPAFPAGLDPAQVAITICDALEQGALDLPSDSF